MQLKFLGTGTSQGIPVIGCKCKVCTSEDPRDNRLRSSAMITTAAGKKILIDCGPDFRQQMLKFGEENVDAVLITHEHNDHVIGLDDLRPVMFRNSLATPLYSLERVIDEIKNRFPYAFAQNRYPGTPVFETHHIDGDFSLYDCLVEPIKILHGNLPILGFKFRNTAYLTDASSIPQTEINKLTNLDYLIVNCIRKTEPHPAHFVLSDILELNKILKPKKMLLTHISHQFGIHSEETQMLPDNISLAYDGQELHF